MIPRRIKLTGFLCYKNEQEIDFDGSSLWMLTGMNGSGKSSIFDAVTFALFGSHRGGSSSAAELINNESTSMSVEFDFVIDQQLYRIRRGVKMGKNNKPTSTQQISQYQEGANQWQPVMDTQLQAGFNRWIHEKIGLSYETFTSSVLLLQGRAEKLLESKPKERSELLAGIVDLERYQKLFDLADQNRKDLKGQIDLVESQLTGIDEVTEIDALGQEGKVIALEEDEKSARTEIDRWKQIEFQADHFASLHKRLVELQQRQSLGSTLLAQAMIVEAKLTRFRDLTGVIPSIRLIQEKQNAIDETTRQATKFLEQLERDHRRIDEVNHALEQLTGQKTKLVERLAQDRTTADKAKEQLAQNKELLQRWEDYQQELTRLNELAKKQAALPQGLGEKFTQCQNDYQRAIEAARIAPIFSRLSAYHLDYLDAERKREQFNQEQAKLEATGRDARAKHDELKKQYDHFQTELATVTQGFTEANLLHAQAEKLERDFQQTDGEHTCRACGQPLTPGHLAAERTKRATELKAAKLQLQAATAKKTQIDKAYAECQSHVDKAKDGLNDLRVKFKENATHLATVTADFERLDKAYAAALGELPPGAWGLMGLQQPIASPKTPWPQGDHLEKLRQLASSMNSLKANLDKLEEQRKLFDHLATEKSTREQTLARIKEQLGKSQEATVREQDANLKAKIASLATQMKADEHEIIETDRKLEAKHRDKEALQQSTNQLTVKLSGLKAASEQHHDAIQRALGALPQAWQQLAKEAGFAKLAELKAEFEELEALKLEEKNREIQLAKASAAALANDIADCQKQMEAVPPEAQAPRATIQATIENLVKVAKEKAAIAQDGRDQLAIMRRNLTLRTELLAKKKTFEREHHYAKNLAELLGRDRLQRHLVRTAERQILELANNILDRLSGGRIYLRLVSDAEGQDKALDLEAYNRETGGSPINVAFLSGSQKFRVAVSLALAIGQYASKKHRPIESVIIDEGFGCLDRQGKQTMIQELQNLRTHLKCVLLVSHQEDIAESFPDTYHFELSNGSTIVQKRPR